MYVVCANTCMTRDNQGRVPFVRAGRPYHGVSLPMECVPPSWDWKQGQFGQKRIDLSMTRSICGMADLDLGVFKNVVDDRKLKKRILPQEWRPYCLVRFIFFWEIGYVLYRLYSLPSNVFGSRLSHFEPIWFVTITSMILILHCRSDNVLWLGKIDKCKRNMWDSASAQ